VVTEAGHAGDGFGAELVAALGDKVLHGDPDAMTAYVRDQCLIVPAGTPGWVVRARSQADVEVTLTLAERHGIRVVTRGAGTGLAGGANAEDGCVVLSLAMMSRILDIDPVARTARVEAGVLNGDLDAAAAAHGLAYLPDPGSRAISSIGGNIATNAGGMCCTKYGVTGDHVAELSVVLAGGRVLRTGSRTRKNVSGLDLTRLFVGSEGTLGVITEATVWLHPRPAAGSTVVAVFASVERAVAAVSALTLEVAPSVAEIMDSTTLAAVDQMSAMGISGVGAVLLLRCDGPAAVIEADRCEQIAAQFGATETFRTDDESEGAALMEARRLALPALERLGATLLDDVAVPVHRLPALIRGVQAISASRKVTVATFGHAADGNMHPTVVYDPADHQAAERARAAFEDILALAIDLGGVLSGEHGIGVLKRDRLSLQLDEVSLEVMASIKRSLDPLGSLNPGRAY
jgi:glycolate oxidase